MQPSMHLYFVLSFCAHKLSNFISFLKFKMNFFPHPIFLILGAPLQWDTWFIYKYNVPVNKEIMSQVSRMFVKTKSIKKIK